MRATDTNPLTVVDDSAELRKIDRLWESNAEWTLADALRLYTRCERLSRYLTPGYDFLAESYSEQNARLRDNVERMLDRFQVRSAIARERIVSRLNDLTGADYPEVAGHAQLTVMIGLLNCWAAAVRSQHRLS